MCDVSRYHAWVKWILIVGLLAIIGYGLYVWRSVHGAISISEGLIRDAVRYEQHPVIPSMRILIAGDSTAVGVGSAPKDSIAGRIGAANPDADIVNRGVSGYRLADLIPILKTEEGTMYDLVVLQIGANDVTGRTSYIDVKSRLREVLSASTKISRRVIVLTSGDVGLSPVFKWPLSTYMSTRTLGVRKIFKGEIAKLPSVTYIDLYQDREHDVFLTDVEKYYAPDFFHPSGAGYGVWFNQIPEDVRSFRDI